MGTRMEMLETNSACTDERLKVLVRERYGDVKVKIPARPWGEEIEVTCTQPPPFIPAKQWTVKAWYGPDWYDATAEWGEPEQETLERVRGCMALPKELEGMVRSHKGKALREIYFGEPWQEKTIHKGGRTMKFRHRPDASLDEITYEAVRQTSLYYDSCKHVRETKGDELVIRLPECVPVNLRAEDGAEAQIEVSEIATAEEIELQAARQLGELIKVEEIVPNPVEP
jgi:hypothetical protein